ncbi:hypothetical protein F0562_016938 [Nyssa sinensis]|uniref:Uncharacterized protein n=1 Tax=Nyssa sinensis TaxID=561372 RepID=A0A5J4ZFQ3_9ASTE|nr:hypothetical protein F0562_016938 [Nyssa sinensis]
MNNHPSPSPPPPPPQPLLDLRTTAQVIKQTTSIFSSHLFTFLFLAFLILTFRTNVENGTHFITGFIDRDPSLKALLSRIDISGKSLYPSSSDPLVHHHQRRRHRHRRPFLHLTRVGTLDEDFFSGDEDNDRSLFGSNPKTQPNVSFVILNSFDSKLGFSNFVTDNGIRVSEIVRPGFTFKAPEGSLQYIEGERNDDEGSIMNGFQRRNGKMRVKRHIDASASNDAVLAFLQLLISVMKSRKIVVPDRVECKTNIHVSDYEELGAPLIPLKGTRRSSDPVERWHIEQH